jgi:hypothetical protein
MLNHPLKIKEMKQVKKYLYLALILPLFTSCSESFLEHEPYKVSTDAIYFSTIRGISEGLTGTYANLNTLPAGAQNLDIQYLVFGSFASDEAEAGGEMGGNDQVAFQDADKGIFKPTETINTNDNFWAYNYKTILRANSVIKGIATYKTNNSGIPADSSKLLDQFEGEARFILAFTHFKLVQVYGGVPIIDHELGATEYGITRKTIAECLHFVQEQLTTAIPLLPLRSQYPDSEYGRVTKGAAQSLLAKAYLYESSYAENYSGDARFEGCKNNYALALQTAETVINSGEYELIGLNGDTFDTFWNQDGSTMYPTSTPGYRYIFSLAGENSKEHIFAIQAINDGINYMQSRGTYLNIYMASRYVGTDNTGWGWGFNCPTEDLKNAYDPNDLRLKVAIGATGDPIYLASGWSVLDCHASPTNMMSRKYEVSGAEYAMNPNSSGPTNFPYIRYADVILLAAEAAFKTNDNPKALNYVNQIRKRARNGASVGVPADLTTVSFDDIVKERQLELSLEGHRFFDLVRWGRQEILTGQPLQNYYNGAPQPSPVSCQFTPGKNDFFPIPQVEIINSNGNLVQYPSW